MFGGKGKKSRLSHQSGSSKDQEDDLKVRDSHIYETGSENILIMSVGRVAVGHDIYSDKHSPPLSPHISKR